MQSPRNRYHRGIKPSLPSGHRSNKHKVYCADTTESHLFAKILCRVIPSLELLQPVHKINLSIQNVPTGPEIWRSHGSERRRMSQSFCLCLPPCLFVVRTVSLKPLLRLRPLLRFSLPAPAASLPFLRSSCFNFFPVGEVPGDYLQKGCIAYITMAGREIHFLDLDYGFLANR